ncbi:MAG: DUF4446 family protein [Candidatus Ryanbacteria bacterium]|nr:DUF4446 family protein [Candidatus Ryanbacteria bacterium]
MQVALVVFGIALVACGARLFYLEKKFKKIFGGGDPKTLETLVVEHAGRIEEAEQALRQLGDAHSTLAQDFLGSIQKVSMVRFNPFSDTGGDQSFVIALLDGKNDGVIFSSLYTRGQPLVYAKPIKAGASHYQLSKEEADALARAIQSA